MIMRSNDYLRQNINDLIDQYHSPRKEDSIIRSVLKRMFSLAYMIKVIRAWMELPIELGNIRCELQKITEQAELSNHLEAIRFRLWEITIKIDAQTSVYETNHREIMNHLRSNVTTNNEKC